LASSQSAVVSVWVQLALAGPEIEVIFQVAGTVTARLATGEAAVGSTVR
jgi:hypothetical protein